LQKRGYNGTKKVFWLLTGRRFGQGLHSMKWLKLLIAVLLLPACVALTMSTWQLGHQFAFGPQAAASHLFAVAFGAGYAVWLAIFVLLPKPMRTYVLGHELTHALWALMMGARVSGLKVKKTGGQVKTSKTNWFITLAPYFFPFYAMLFIILFFVAHALWNLTEYLWVLFFLIGLGWSFHVTFTLMMLLSVRQPDVRSQGVLFSAVVIYLMNLLTIILTATLLSRSLTTAALASSFGQNCLLAYGWTLDKLVALWQYVAAFVSHKR
jgi:hypothetical protein